MARVIEDGGAVAAVSKPLRIPSYQPTKLPDPATCVNALIIVNDRTDGTPRGRLAVSNGASWDHVAWLSELPASPAQVTVDVTPLVARSVRQLLPAIVQQHLPPPAPVMLTAEPAPAPGKTEKSGSSGFAGSDQQVNPPSSEELAIVAQAMIDMTQQINELLLRVHDLEHQVDYLKRNAVHRDGVTVKVEAA